MLWHRQAIFKSKGDKLCSSAECRIWTRGPRHQIASRLNAHWQTDWAIEDQAKTWTRQPVPMISEHSAHLTPLSVDFSTWLWRYTYLLLLISMLWHRQAIFKSKGNKLCYSAACRIWTWGPRHQIASRLNAHWQTDWAIEDQAKTWTRQPVPLISEHSAPLTPLTVDFRTWLWRYTYLLLLISMLWHRQAILKSKGDKLCSSAECRIWTRGPRHQIASRLNAHWQTDWAIEDQAKTWTRQPVPMISEHSAHLTPLSVDFRTWLWRYTHLLLLISMLWHRQAIFKSKGDKLCSSAECRIWTRGPRHQIASRLNAHWQTDWAIEDQAKTWTRQPVPMISEHSAHLTPLSVDFSTWLWRYTYLLLLISMLWHRQAIFKSKGNKLCYSAACRIWTWGPRHQIASRLNAHWQTDWAIEDQAKTWTRQPVPLISEHSAHLTPLFSWLSHLALAIYIFVVVNFDALAQASDIQIERRQVVFLCWMQDLNPGPQTPNRQQTECSLTNRLSYRGSSKNLNSTARPYDQRAFSPLDPTVSWLSHLALAIYIFVVVNFDALAQASDIQIERRQVVFLCWMQDLNPGPQTPNRQQTECSLTNRLSYRGSSKNLNSTARPYDQRAFSPLDPTVSWLSHLALAIYIFVVVNFDALAQASDIQIERRQVVFSAECRIWTWGPRHQIASRLNAHWQTDWAIEDQAKTWTRQPVPMISEHSAHLTPLSVDFRTWLWRYTYLLLLISMLWHRQAIFKSKGDKLCSSAECRIWTRGPRHQIASRLNAHWQTDWAIEDQAKTWTRQPVPMISEHSAHLTPLSVDFRTWLWRYTYLLLLISMLWHRQAIFKSKGDKLCSSAECRIWTRGPRHQIASRLNAHWQTDWAIEDQAKTWTRQPVPMISEHSAHLTPLSVDFRTWLWRYTYLLLLISMLWHRQAIFKSKGDKLCSSAECRIWTRGPRHQIASRLNAHWQTDWAIEDQAKTWTRQPVPMISEHSAHLTPLSVDFRTWLWRYTYLLLLISMLWHRQAIFKSKGDKLCSSAECRIWTRGPRHQIASRLNAHWQTDWAIEDQAKTWTRQPVPMISEHSAHLTPLSVDFRTWLWRYTYLLLLISMLWHRQAIFKSKGDKLCSSAECRIWTRGPRHQIASRLNAHWQTDWAIEDQAKTWTRQPVPMISEHSAHLTPLSVDFRTWLWRYTYLLLLISMLWHRQAIFKSKGDKLCSSAECRIWTRGPRHQIASRLNAHWQTDWAIEDQAKTWTRQPVPLISEHSAHLTPLSVDFRTWLWRYTYLLLLISMLWHRQAIFKSKGDKLCSSAECRIWTRGPRHQIASRLNAHWQTDWAIEDQAKTWTRQPVPMISEHSAHLTPLSVDFRTWLWRYTCCC